MIRVATIKDLPQLISLATKCHEENNWIFPSSEETLDLQLRNLLLHRGSAIFVNDENGSVNGVAGGPLTSWPYDLDVCVLQEYLTYGENMKELKKYLYKWAMEKGAKGIVKLCIDDSNGPRTFAFKIKEIN